MRNNNKRSNNITLTQVRHSIPFIQYHQSNYLPVSIHKYIVQQYRIQKITAEARDTFTHTSVCAYVSTPHSQVATSLCHGSLSFYPLRRRWSPADAVCVLDLGRAAGYFQADWLTDWLDALWWRGTCTGRCGMCGEDTARCTALTTKAAMLWYIITGCMHMYCHMWFRSSLVK